MKKTYYFETEKTEKETIIKNLFIENLGAYNDENIEEMANWCSVEKEDIIRIAENEFESDVIALKRMAEYFSTSVDHLIGEIK